MRKPLALLVLAAGPLLLLRRRMGRRESVSLHYEDGSSVTLDSGTPGADRLLALARQAR